VKDAEAGSGTHVSRWAGPLARLDPDACVRLLGIVAAGLVACVLFAARAQWLKWHDGYVFGVLVHGAVFAIAVWVVLTVRLGRRALLLILLIAALLRVIAFVVPVGLTSDGYRYVWDGRLQAAGVNPYLTVPADPRLAHLRDDAIYPNINGKDTYPTIYPPLAQMSFLIGTRLHDSIEGIKLLLALVEAGIVAALLAWLKLRGLPRERVLIYAWHPLPMWEFTGNGHVDAVAVLCVILAIVAAERGRQTWVGAALAGAALVKYWPAYLGAALWRRWDWRLFAGAVLAALLLYTPYVFPQVISLGFPGVEPTQLLGSLFKHLNDEGYSTEGWGFFLAYAPKHFGWFDVGGQTYARFAAIGLGLLAAAIALRRDMRRPLEPWHLIVLISAFLLAVSPHYPWYYAIAVPLLAVCCYLPLLWVTLIVSVIYVEIDYVWLVPYPRFKAYLLLYGGCLASAALVWWLGARRDD
jgi:hypothetical protein